MTAMLLRQADILDGFELPPELEAGTPPELRGEGRDDVRLMVASPLGIDHRRFSDLSDVLTPGDLLIVNLSATLPASLVLDDELVLHLSTELPGGLWSVEVRRAAGRASLPLDDEPPRRLSLPEGGHVELLAPYPVGSTSRRLWAAALALPLPAVDYLERWGRPIRYPHVSGSWPIASYQTMFSRIPGSAEMPGAARPMTPALLTDLAINGVSVAPVTLHTGVSSLESGEEPYPERFEVPEATARLVNHTRDDGGRVIAVGTTTVRAIESTADHSGRSHPGRGWTDLVVTPSRGVRVVDGLLTGWHEPASTHLEMLEAIGGRRLIGASYEAALSRGYLWHEFGDSHLIVGPHD